MKKVLLLMVVAIQVSLSGCETPAGKQERKVYADCAKAGGVLFWPERGWVCLKREAFLMISPNFERNTAKALKAE